MNRKPILCLDFDGVCHSYTSGWQGATVMPDDAVPGLFEFLEEAAPHFDIHVYSTRSETPEGRDAMALWFADQRRKWRANGGQGSEVVSITFPASKPSAFIGLDDRVLTFKGLWPSVHLLRKFKPWNKGGAVDKLSAAEALYAFMGWLTCLDQAVVFSARHDAAVASELVDEFCKANNLEEPREGWPAKSTWPTSRKLYDITTEPAEGSATVAAYGAVGELVVAAENLLQFRQGILGKEYDKLSPTLAGALHDLAMAVKKIREGDPSNPETDAHSA